MIANDLGRMRTFYGKNWKKAIEIGHRIITTPGDERLQAIAYSELLYCYSENGDEDAVIRYGEEFLQRNLPIYNQLGVMEFLISAFWTKENYTGICELAERAMALAHQVTKEDLPPEDIKYYDIYYLAPAVIGKMTAYLMVSAIMNWDQSTIDLLSAKGMDLIVNAYEEQEIGNWIVEALNILNIDEQRCGLIRRITPEKWTSKYDFEKFAGIEVDASVYDKSAEDAEWDAFLERCEEVGFIDLRQYVLTFSKEYFDPETRDGFYIEQQMKNAWAGNLEVLYKVDILCQALGIRYFANWGTLLGTIRHKGYIPWDDDLDIGVLRKDYNKLKYAIANLQDELQFYDNYNEGDWGAHASKITNSLQFLVNREMLKRYHGFGFFSSIDVFVVDTVPRDKKLEREQYDVIRLIGEMVHTREEMKDADPESEEYKNYQRVEHGQVETLKKLCNMEFEQEVPTTQELFILSDEVQGLYPEAQSDYYTVPHRLAGGQDYYIPKDVFSDFLRMPFENITVNVPRGYDFILRKNYGENYMTPINRGGGHGYPFYGKLIDTMVEDRKKSTREETLDYIKNISYGYYYNFIHQTNQTSYVIPKESLQNDTARIQAAELEVYAEILRLCQKKGLKCFALGETAEQARTCRGFAEGAEGIHLGMLRDDYIEFMNCLGEELGSWFNYESIYLDDGHEDLRTYILTDAFLVTDEDYLERFHGCNDIVAIDVSPLDAVDPNPEMDDVRKGLIRTMLRTWKVIPVNGPYSDAILSLVDEWTDKIEITISKEGNLRRNFLKTIDSVASSYRKESDTYRVTPDLQIGVETDYSKESLDQAEELSFGPTKILVPRE